ncbi:hypothetical protein CTAYLR_007046 [Chrysophaeum taylorii]|uniref:PKD/REJ-like domain-containing protein n=1 Tax=Chrysophaeum taylorii TaxID=2483200 RepID=A0AAD7XMM9_9STRA|nr:hypothetical protein CTAYLR_007046 [Chrysophaeum taylorii]
MLTGNASRYHPLVIAPLSLVPGGTYTFELEATLGSNRGYASISVTAIEPPTSGDLDVTPPAGFALYTSFKLLAEGWVSAEPPLQYRFETERGIMRASSPDNVLEKARFPIGIAPPSLQVTVVVTDALEGSASESRNVNVTLSNTSSSLVNEVNDALSTGFAEYSLSEICQVVVSTAGILDDDEEVLETIVSALADAVENLVDPELEQLELSIESSRALTETNLNDASGQEVLEVLDGLTSTLASVGLGASGSTVAVKAVTEALSNLLAKGLLFTAPEATRRHRLLEDGSPRVASDVLLQTVDALTQIQRETLAANEDATGVEAANLKTASKVISNEIKDGVQEIGLAFMNASSSIAPDDGSVYAISITEFLVNPHDLEEIKPALSRIGLLYAR